MNRAFILRLLCVLLLVASASFAQAVSYDQVNDFNGWLNNLQSLGTTTIGTGTFIADPGNSTVPVVQGVPGLSFSTNGGNVVFDLIGSGPTGRFTNTLLMTSDYLEWQFPGPQNGFGGTFIIGEGNATLSFEALDLTLGWIDACNDCLGPEYNGFFGFTSADQFAGVRVFAGDGGSSYSMTDVSVGAVPIPGAIWLLGPALGLVGISFGRRRRKS